MCKYYQVGGCVRDRFINEIFGTQLKIKDIDYSVEAESYLEMKEDIISRGGQIFLENPEYFTIRANVPGFGACDYVLCRKDGVYYDGRRPDAVYQGTIYDDLARRDFTMNAIAVSEDGEVIDPFNGIDDIKAKIIRCVGSIENRMSEDSLRVLRAIRFSITKDFEIEDNLFEYIANHNYDLSKISVERIYEELRKMFSYDTLKTIFCLSLADMMYIFSDFPIKLEPTLKQ